MVQRGALASGQAGPPPNGYRPGRARRKKAAVRQVLLRVGRRSWRDTTAAAQEKRQCCLRDRFQPRKPDWRWLAKFRFGNV
jgi:hypothetical protein